MKVIALDVQVSDKNYEVLKDIYTNAELEKLVAKFLLDTAEMSNPKTQEKILQESRKVMNQLKNININERINN